jgi:hypothetical protein
MYLNLIFDMLQRAFRFEPKIIRESSNAVADYEKPVIKLWIKKIASFF